MNHHRHKESIGQPESSSLRQKSCQLEVSSIMIMIKSGITQILNQLKKRLFYHGNIIAMICFEKFDCFGEKRVGTGECQEDLVP